MSEWMKQPPNNPYDNWWVVDEEGTPLAGCRDEAAANRVILDHELAALAEETRAAIVSNTSSAADAWHTFCVRYDYCALKAQAKAREVLSKDSCSRCGHSEHPLLRCDSCGTNGSRCTPARDTMAREQEDAMWTDAEWQCFLCNATNYGGGFCHHCNRPGRAFKSAPAHGEQAMTDSERNHVIGGPDSRRDIFLTSEDWKNIQDNIRRAYERVRDMVEREQGRPITNTEAREIALNGLRKAEAERDEAAKREQCAHQRIEDCPATVVGTCKTCGKPYCRYHAKEHGGAHQGSKS